MTARISIVEAMERGQEGLAQTLRTAGYEVRERASPIALLEETAAEADDLLLLEVHPGSESLLGELSGLRARGQSPRLVGVVQAADVDSAVRAMRAGAADVLQRPITTERLLACVEALLTPAAGRAGTPSRLLGDSEAMRGVRERIERVAATPTSTVLITGESGVGKELVAREIHSCSSRAHSPFVALNCASLSEALLEAELFGYAPGAFTGGRPKGQEGLVAAAEGGILFLDEVGELSLVAQAKLLRFLQERRYRPVGDSRERKCDLRVLAATNRDLQERVEAGAFREDLYYRLNVLSIHLPPLRERPEDLPMLARAKLADPSFLAGLAPHTLDTEALELLARHRWPGNVRELESVLARALLHASAGRIDGQALQASGWSPPAAPVAKAVQELATPTSLREAEEQLIRRALRSSGGNKSRAARELGIHRATLYQKLRSLGLTT